MERLTIPDEKIDERTTRMTVVDGGAVREHAMEFYWRLKAYEDTGLTPDEIKSMQGEHFSGLEMAKLHGALMELKKYQAADNDGRLVVLPCKVGDVVYGFHGRRTILPMVAKWIETNTDGWSVAAQYVPMAPKFYQFSNFGKTVFLTREEAKKALEAMKDE